MGKFISLNKDGTLNSQGDTAGPGNTSISVLPFGHYFRSSIPANNVGQFCNVITNQNGGSFGQTGKAWVATHTGLVTNISVYENGPNNGRHLVQIKVNNVGYAFIPVGTGGNYVGYQAPAGIFFKPNDVITAFLLTEQSADTNCECHLTLALLP